MDEEIGKGAFRKPDDITITMSLAMPEFPLNRNPKWTVIEIASFSGVVTVSRVDRAYAWSSNFIKLSMMQPCIFNSC